MTVYELIHELQKHPEDAEILVYSCSGRWTHAISDSETMDLEHAADGTPILYLYTE